MKNTFKKQKAFTLIEILITVALITLIALISIPVYQGYKNRVRIAAVLETLATFKLPAIVDNFRTKAAPLEINNIINGVEKLNVTVEKVGDNITIKGVITSNIPQLNQKEVELYTHAPNLPQLKNINNSKLYSATNYPNLDVYTWNCGASEEILQYAPECVKNEVVNSYKASIGNIVVPVSTVNSNETLNLPITILKTGYTDFPADYNPEVIVTKGGVPFSVNKSSVVNYNSSNGTVTFGLVPDGQTWQAGQYEVQVVNAGEDDSLVIGTIANFNVNTAPTPSEKLSITVMNVSKESDFMTGVEKLVVEAMVLKNDHSVNYPDAYNPVITVSKKDGETIEINQENEQWMPDIGGGPAVFSVDLKKQNEYDSWEDGNYVLTIEDYDSSEGVIKGTTKDFRIGAAPTPPSSELPDGTYVANLDFGSPDIIGSNTSATLAISIGDKNKQYPSDYNPTITITTGVGSVGTISVSKVNYDQQNGIANFSATPSGTWQPGSYNIQVSANNGVKEINIDKELSDNTPIPLSWFHVIPPTAGGIDKQIDKVLDSFKGRVLARTNVVIPEITPTTQSRDYYDGRMYINQPVIGSVYPIEYNIFQDTLGSPSIFTNLRKIVIPASYGMIGDNAFSNIKSNVSGGFDLVFEPNTKVDGIRSEAFANSDIKKFELIDPVEKPRTGYQATLGDGLFKNTPKLEEVILDIGVAPGGVTIGNNLFTGSTNMCNGTGVVKVRKGTLAMWNQNKSRIAGPGCNSLRIQELP